MVTEPNQQQLKKYLDLLLYRKKLIITIFLLSVIIGLGLYLKTPRTYETTALLIYQQQQITTSKLSPVDTRQIGIMVGTVSQQVTSRVNLEQMIREFDLYTAARQALPMEDVIEIMREKHISIKAQQRKSDVFSISFQNSDPRKALLVTNELAAKFIEENMRFREERAAKTSAYIQSELGIAREALDKKEAVMRDYKLKYYNEMAGQRQANMSRLNALQEQYQTNQINIHNMEQTRLLVFEQISLRKDLLTRLFPLHAETAPPQQGTINQQPTKLDSLRTLQNNLTIMLTKYTDKHPDIRRLKSQIKTLEEKKTAQLTVTQDEISSEHNGSSEENTLAQSPALPAVILDDQQLTKLNLQLKEIEMNIARLTTGRGGIEEQIKIYQRWIDAAPVRGAEWAALTRDYDQFQQHYDYLVAKSLVAQSAESLERKQKGSQFKIIDPAHLPGKPIKPDFMRIMLMTIAAGLGLSGVLILSVDFFNTSFKEASDLETDLGLPVVCSIPLVPTKGESRRRRINAILWGFLLVAAGIAVCAGIIYLGWKGLIIV